MPFVIGTLRPPRPVPTIVTIMIRPSERDGMDKKCH
jgi:hypothetical protein